MLSVLVAQVLGILTYLWLAVSVAIGRPPLPRRGTPPAGPARAEGGSAVVEVVWLGSLALVFLYPLGVLFFPATFLRPPFVVLFPGDAAVQVVGFALIVLGGGLVGWAFRSLGRFATVQIRISSDHRIVREGPYARMRHPMYTANMLLALGITLAYLSVWLWVPFALVLLLALWRAREEERLFLSTPELAPAYAEYVATTGRFLPSPVGCGRSAP